MYYLKVGVIGTGHMGKNHVRNLSEEKRFDFVGIFDADMEQAKNLAAQYDIKAFETMDDLLKEVEAVIIAVPSSLHKKVALEVANHGVHALVEKPLATNSEDAQIIVDEFKSRNLQLSVGHIERFNPAFRELQKLINNRDAFYIEACRYSPFSGSGRITDTSVVEDLMIHDIDLVCALMDDKKVTSIHGRGESVQSGQTDFATCFLDFEGKAHAVINASRVAQNKERRIIVHMADACISANLLTREIEIYKSTNLTVDLPGEHSYRQDGIVQKVYVPIVEPLRAELIDFYNSIVNDVPAIVDGDVAVKAIKITEYVSNSAKMQRR